MADLKNEKHEETQTSEKAGQKLSLPASNGVIFYGSSDKVTPLGNADYNDFVGRTAKKQELPGFDPEYNDIVDYILRITHRIWEERGVGVIFDTYHNNTIVHRCSTTSSGVLPVISGTLSDLHGFPDRKIVAESAIWSEDSPGYFFTSHRCTSSATNLGDSNFGKVTGKKIQYRSCADCCIHQNRIFEEWLVRDNLAIVKQLGLDPREVALSMAKAQASDAETALRGGGKNDSMEGQFYPKLYTAKNDTVGEQMLELHNNIFHCKRIDLVKQYFAPGALVHFIGNKELYGREEIQGTIISLLASFPNAFHMVERVTCNDRPGRKNAWDVAVRWRLRGVHEGIGMFGDPTGKPVEIMGIDQYRIEDGKVQEAWVLFDGLDVFRQIANTQSTGDAFTEE